MDSRSRPVLPRMRRFGEACGRVPWGVEGGAMGPSVRANSRHIGAASGPKPPAGRAGRIHVGASGSKPQADRAGRIHVGAASGPKLWAESGPIRWGRPHRTAPRRVFDPPIRSGATIEAPRLFSSMPCSIRASLVMTSALGGARGEAVEQTCGRSVDNSGAGLFSAGFS